MAIGSRLLALALLALSIPAAVAQAQAPLSKPGTCDADDGKYRTTESGPTFKLVCNYSVVGAEILKTVSKRTFEICIETCGATPGCQALNFDPQSWECTFYKTATRGTKATAGKHNAYAAMDPSKVTSSSSSTTTSSSTSSTTSSSTSTSGSSSSTSSSTGSASATSSSAPATPTDSSPNRGPGPTDPNIKITTDPKCPDEDGKAFLADDGTYYKLQCNRHTPGKTLATLQNIATFEQCMQECSKMNGCISVQYMPSPPASGYTDPLSCILSDGEGPGTAVCGHWFAYTVDPPATTEDKPFPHALCETACPVSDGLIYESESGESFRMSCSKRHGTKILWAITTETFAECMESCGKFLACHSVDYQARTKKCYHGNHHTEPGVSAAGFSSATTIGCSGACKKSCSCSAGAKE